MKSRISLLLVLLFVCGMVQAQTPDGLTPPNEGVCNELLTATPGLYGLCIAYCEAQDFDDVDSDHPSTFSKVAPKEKILSNYNRKMQAGDPEMPCIQVPIPCWTEEEIGLIGTAAEPGFQTVRHQIYDCPGVREGETWYLEEQYGSGEGRWAGVWYRLEENTIGCWWSDSNANIQRTFYFESMDDFDNALDSIISRATELGWYPSRIWETIYDCP